MSSSAPLAAARGIRVQFGGSEVLHGVDLALLPGEVHAITGENGAGKSTLARVIAGIYRPSAGLVEVGGKPVAFRSPTEAAAAGIVLVHQEPMTFNDLSIAENIYLSERPRNRLGLIDWATLNRKASELLASLGRKYDPQLPVGRLTLAGRQMVEVASAMAQGARVLILDETTAALSPGEVDELFTVVRRLRDEGCAIGIVSHRLQEVFSLCDRVTVLRDGAKVAEVLPSESDVGSVVRLMVGRDLEPVVGRAVTPREPVLEVSDLEVSGVRGVSFAVRAGEIVAFSGLVGSGRTEIAHAIFGITRPERGSIRLDGREISVKSPRHALRLGLALVPEDRLHHGIVSQMSLSENVSLPILGRLGRPLLRRKKERNLAGEWISRLGVVCRSPNQPISQLSGGNQQKLVIGKWLETKPRLLMVDEPTRGIDVGAKAAVHSLLRSLAAEGLAILVISSDLPEVLSVADRIIVMREGRIAREFNGSEAGEESVMLAATGQDHHAV